MYILPAGFELSRCTSGWAWIHVLDASGTPLTGATVNLTIRYPGGREGTDSRLLGSGDGALVHLELAPYFDYLLPTGASLPACDPAHDFHVEVTLSAMVNDTVSLEAPSFDNCAYLHAMAAATGPAALSFTLTVPVNAGGAPEICDGIDNDLDGLIDEGVLNTYHQDSDGDTYGNASGATQACTQPSGFVTDNTDCNDGNA